MNWKEVFTPTKAEVIINVIISLFIALFRENVKTELMGGGRISFLESLIQGYGGLFYNIINVILGFIISVVVLYVVFRILTYSASSIFKKKSGE